MRYSRLGYWGIPAVAVAVIFVGMRLISHALPSLTWANAIATAVVVVTGLLAVLLAYRYSDEVMLQTHKTAWFWGGLVGLIASVPVVIVVQQGLIRIPLLMAHFGDGSSVYFTEGGAVVILLQMIGFLTVLAYQRWLRPEQ